MSARGIASGQRVKRSIIVRQYRWPSQLVITTMSRCICANLPVGAANVPGGFITCLEIFAFWHSRHARAHLLQSAFIRGHTNLSVASLTDAFDPGCASPCMTSNAARLNCGVTNGRAFGVDRSQKILVCVPGISTCFNCRLESFRRYSCSYGSSVWDCASRA